MKYVLLALALMVQNAQAGIVNCNRTEMENLGSYSAISNDGVLKVDLQLHRFLADCGLGIVNRQVQVSARVSPVDGDYKKVPNGGYIDGQFTSLDSSGNILDHRNYEGSYFVVDMYPFAADKMRQLRADIDGFSTITIVLK